MASPQLENGYTRIANELLDALMRTNFSAYQSRVLWVILRKTYGFNKKEDWISTSQIVEATGLDKGNVCRARRELIERRVVIKSGNRTAFNKHYTMWRLLPKGATCHHTMGVSGDNKTAQDETETQPRGVSKGTPVVKGDNSVVKGDNKRLSKGTVTKDIKNNIQKKYSPEVFQEVFVYWQEKMNHPQAKLTKDRQAKIGAMLREGYTVDQIKAAIDGCKASPHHMGENKTSTIYDSLKLICRSCDDLERFIAIGKRAKEKANERQYVYQ
jgi:phage replication O-like protein O